MSAYPSVCVPQAPKGIVFPCDDGIPRAGFRDDTNNFDVQELRVHFGGHAFWNTLKYFVELNIDAEYGELFEVVPSTAWP